MEHLITAKARISDKTLKLIAHLPPAALTEVVAPEFLQKLGPDHRFGIAAHLARRHFNENGIPSGRDAVYTDQLITAGTPVTNGVLKLIAHLPPQNMLDVVEEGFFQKLSNDDRVHIGAYRADLILNRNGCDLEFSGAPAHITAGTPVTEAALKAIAYIPTASLGATVEDAFQHKLTDDDFMRVAFLLAEKGRNEGGCFIGGVVRDRKILGKGHNEMVQGQVLSIHGETAAANDATRNAKLDIDFSKTTMDTTLSPCLPMCTPFIIRMEFGRVCVGDITNVSEENSGQMIKRLTDHGVKVDIRQNAKGIRDYLKYRNESPGQDMHDWLNIREARKLVPGYVPPGPPRRR